MNANQAKSKKISNKEPIEQKLNAQSIIYSSYFSFVFSSSLFLVFFQNPLHPNYVTQVLINCPSCSQSFYGSIKTSPSCSALLMLRSSYPKSPGRRPDGEK